MTEYLNRSWAKIDLDAISYNIAQIRNLLKPGCQLMAVVKADAYGHGACQTAKQLAACGADWFGVSNLEEALELRGAGLLQPILIFGYTPAQYAGLLSREAITQTVFSLDYARALQQVAAQHSAVLSVQFKLDTGMTRLGFLCDDEAFAQSVADMQQAAGLPNLRLGGAFTHLSAADEYTNDSPAFTRMQIARFVRMTQALEARGLHLPLRHCCNSAGVIAYPEAHFDLVRPGNILYGMDPSPECAGMLHLQPALSLCAVVASVKQVRAGAQVSYGRTWTLPYDASIAVVPIGYADGYRRGLSRKAHMLLHGQPAPVLGAVCMDQLMLDVSAIPGVQPGDEVVAIGRQGDACITPDDLAALLGTINYEITCGLTRRIPRVYLRGGREIAVECYGLPTLQE